MFLEPRSVGLCCALSLETSSQPIKLNLAFVVLVWGIIKRLKHTDKNRLQAFIWVDADINDLPKP